METNQKYAAIDIGSNAVRLLLAGVFETEHGPYFKKTSLIRMPLRLGQEAFTQGRFSEDTAGRLTHTIAGFAQLIKAYQPLAFRACATSAMREAQNGSVVCEAIRKHTDIDIEIIQGQEEAEILFANRNWNNLQKNSATVYVDVGGGSTEVTLFAHNTTQSASFNIGTIRLLNELVQNSSWQALKQWMRTHTMGFRRVDAIGSGGNINKLVRMAKTADKDRVGYNQLKRVRQLLKSFTVAERITQLGLKPDRADVIVPALRIYLSVMKWGGIERMAVPQIGLADGLVRLLYYKHKAI